MYRNFTKIHEGLKVYVVGASVKVSNRIEKLGIFELISTKNVKGDRTEALRDAVDLVASR